MQIISRKFIHFAGGQPVTMQMQAQTSRAATHSQVILKLLSFIIEKTVKLDDASSSSASPAIEPD